MERRSFMAGVASLACARWEADDVDLDALGDQESIGIFTTGEFEPSGNFTFHTSLKFGDLEIQGGDFENRRLNAQYDYSGPFLAAEFDRSDGTSTSFLLSLDPKQARHLGAALYQAAEEHEARWEK